MQKISNAMLILTHACPLKCVYCFVHQDPSRMTLETAMDSVKFLISNAEETGQVPGINFFGGEPMVMWDDIIVPLTNWIRQEYKKPFSLSITTNGVLLNEERIKFMKDNGFGILLSIDGAKETQDYNRPYHNGKGSFDTLEPLLPNIVSSFPNVTFRSTAIPATCEHVFENIMFAKDNGFKNFFVIPNVFEEWSDEAKATLAEELNKYIDYYIDEYRSSRVPIAFSAMDDALRDIKRINYAVNNNSYRTLTNCSACGKCGLGANRYGSIHPNGNIYGCQEMTSNEGDESIFYIGNIYTGVEDDRRQALMDLFDSKVSKGPNCDACKYDHICNGGCVANNYLLTGDMNIVAPVFCWWQQIVLDGAIRIMQTLGNERNEMFKKKWGGIK